MKILVLSHISELLGGAERSMIDVVQTWVDDYGVEPEFILRKPLRGLQDEIKKRGWRYYALDYGFWSLPKPYKNMEETFLHGVTNSQAIIAIEKIIKDSKPDVVITNSVVCPWAAIAAYYQDVPHVWFVREYGDLDHGRIFEIGQQQTFEDVGNLSVLVVANSKAIADHVGQYIDKAKVTTLYPVIDQKTVADRAEGEVKNPYASADSLKLVITGNLAPSKGQLEAVKAVGELKRDGINAELCIVGGEGEPAYFKQLKDMIKDYSIKDKVHFVGYQKNPLPYIKLADVGIMASKMEAFGRVTLEYLVLGKAVVAVGAGGTKEMVENGVNGWLFEPSDIKGLTDGLTKYAGSRKLIEQHGEASKKRASQIANSEYNVANTYKKTEQAVNNFQPNRAVHFTHRAFEYQAMIRSSGFALKRLLVGSAKFALRPTYHVAKGFKEKITGK